MLCFEEPKEARMLRKTRTATSFFLASLGDKKDARQLLCLLRLLSSIANSFFLASLGDKKEAIEAAERF